ncbi:hypothetical protein PTKIN_Ptkin11bG0109200 [Pterospermum kingtungense]
MESHAFVVLCQKLRGTGILKDYRRATVKEQVAKFLHIFGQNFHNRALGFYFQRFGETISRHFHNVLRAVIALEGELLKQPIGFEVPPEIHNNQRFYPYFKRCSLSLKKYSKRGPENEKELFNHRHASLRNVIERAFDPDENLIHEVDMELYKIEDSNSVGGGGVAMDANTMVGEMIRNNIAENMWIDYLSHR